jgi:hypothetical protein
MNIIQSLTFSTHAPELTHAYALQLSDGHAPELTYVYTPKLSDTYLCS